MARRFFPLASLKVAVDTIAKSGARFLHLHFSDDEGYRLESRVLSNAARDGAVLSIAEVKELVEYARGKNVQVIPEINILSHSGGVRTLRPDLANAAGTEIDIAKSAVIKELVSEVYDMFGKPQVFHLGMDEFGYDAAWLERVIEYVNDVAAHVKSLGAAAAIWNDGVTPASNATLDKDIAVWYWNESDNTAIARSTKADLIAGGRKVVETDSYYLYFVPKSQSAVAADATFAGGEVTSKWAPTAGASGRLVAVWMEDSEDGFDTTVISEGIYPLLKAVVDKA